MDDKKIKLYIALHLPLFLVVIIVITLVAGYMFRISPAQANLSNFDAQVRVIQTSKDEQARIASILKDNVEYFKSIDPSDMWRFEVALPTAKEVMPDLYTQLDALIKSGGTTMGSLGISEYKIPKPKKDEEESASDQALREHVKVLAIVTKVGLPNWPSVKNLLGNIESHLHLMDISSFVYNAKQGSLDMNIKTYYIPIGETK